MAQLKSGQKAPSFNHTDINGQVIELERFEGLNVLLSFYRYAACPLCNLRVNELVNRYDAWHNKGLEMIAVFQSPVKSILQYIGKHDAPFPILPDPDQHLYKLYHVQGDWMKFVKGMKPGKIFSAAKKGFLPGKIETELTMIPADFLINKTGNIEIAYYGKDASDHLDTTIIESYLNSFA